MKRRPDVGGMIWREDSGMEDAESGLWRESSRAVVSSLRLADLQTRRVLRVLRGD